MVLNGSLEIKTLYITLDSRPEAGTYHWGLIITDANDEPVLHHASNTNGPWSYQRRLDNPDESMTLVAIVRIAKVKSVSEAEQVIQSISASGYPSQRTSEAFTCRIWVKDVLVALEENGVIVLPNDIDNVEGVAIEQGYLYASHSEQGGGATVINDAFSG
ncbi:hypothetical protein F503_06844 [Ophiostoma piceae UAMH 11346]|uniref:Uncharacterized protein n=1 Tax=Ophiostoma piceae (strain UAMH 11346) TaxID=1262450 RepID=S3CR39_OPHP1|nr:hypothetical protein F503_06844 [Ophiostoma piceae UAMH 11346]